MTGPMARALTYCLSHANIDEDDLFTDGGQTAQSTDDTERIDCDWCSAKFESKFRYICGLRAGIHVLWNHRKEVREWGRQRSTDSETARDGGSR